MSLPSGSADRPTTDRLDLLVGALGVAAAVAAAWVNRSEPMAAVGFVVVVAVSARLAVIDIREHRLPNRIVGPLAAAVAVWLLGLGALDDDPVRGLRAIGIGILVAALLLVANLVGGLGMGDVKYGFPAAATVGWFGWDAVWTMLLVTAITGGLVGAVALLGGRGRGHHLPYGPFLAAGMVAGLLTGA